MYDNHVLPHGVIFTHLKSATRKAYRKKKQDRKKLKSNFQYNFSLDLKFASYNESDLALPFK